MVEAKRPPADDADPPPSKRPSGGSGALEEDLDAELDAQEDQLPEEDVDAMMLDDGIELQLGEAGRNWVRPEPKPHDPKTENLGRKFNTAPACAELITRGMLSASNHFCCHCSLPADGGGLRHWTSQ